MVKENKGIPLGQREGYPYGAMRIADVLKEQGVEVAFGVHGGHIWAMVDAMSNAGIKTITMRHEQAGVYAAEAYAKATGKVGVAYADVGPGVANTVSAIQQAYISCTPLVLLCGGVPPIEDRLYTIQPSYVADLMQHITKWTQRITAYQHIKRFLTEAFRDAQTYPMGPIALDFDWAILAREPAGRRSRDIFYVPGWRRADTAKPVTPAAGDPKAIEKCVNMIFQKERPVLYVGDGVHWGGASKELVEFAEIAQVPVCGRRIARGSMPETHPQYFSSQVGRPILSQSNLFVGIGLKVGFGDNYGQGWPSPIIQINEHPSHIFTFLPTELAIVGNSKVVLQQMIDFAKANNLKANRTDWLKKVQETQQKGYESRANKAMQYSKNAPIHFGYLAKVVWDVAEDLYQGRNRVMIDGFTMSDYMPAFIRARYSGQVMDASEQAGVGHGISMAIGAAFGDKDSNKHPVFAMMGDAGMGLGGMDYETALRCHLPIVYIVTENGGWLPAMKFSHYGKDWGALGAQDREYGRQCLENSRYDKLTEVYGGHGEFVEKPEQIRPALERACKSAEKGIPAIVNVKMDPRVANRQEFTASYQYSWIHIPWDKLPPHGKALRRNLLPTQFPWDELGIPTMPMPDPWDPIKDDWPTT